MEFLSCLSQYCTNNTVEDHSDEEEMREQTGTFVFFKNQDPRPAKNYDFIFKHFLSLNVLLFHVFLLYQYCTSKDYLGSGKDGDHIKVG